MDVDRELRDVRFKCSNRADAMARLAVLKLKAQYPLDTDEPPVSPAEAWGRAVRQMNDALTQFAREFTKGYNHG